MPLTFRLAIKKPDEKELFHIDGQYERLWPTPASLPASQIEWQLAACDTLNTMGAMLSTLTEIQAAINNWPQAIKWALSVK